MKEQSLDTSFAEIDFSVIDLIEKQIENDRKFLQESQLKEKDYGILFDELQQQINEIGLYYKKDIENQNSSKTKVNKDIQIQQCYSNRFLIKGRQNNKVIIESKQEHRNDYNTTSVQVLTNEKKLLIKIADSKKPLKSYDRKIEEKKNDKKKSYETEKTNKNQQKFANKLSNRSKEFNYKKVYFQKIKAKYIQNKNRQVTQESEQNWRQRTILLGKIFEQKVNKNLNTRRKYIQKKAQCLQIISYDTKRQKQSQIKQTKEKKQNIQKQGQTKMQGRTGISHENTQIQKSIEFMKNEEQKNSLLEGKNDNNRVQNQKDKKKQQDEKSLNLKTSSADQQFKKNFGNPCKGQEYDKNQQAILNNQSKDDSKKNLEFSQNNFQQQPTKNTENNHQDFCQDVKLMQEQKKPLQKKNNKQANNLEELKNYYNQQNWDLLNQNFPKNFKKGQLNFIDLDKVYQDDSNTLLEKCIFNRQYKNLEKFCFDQLKRKYNLNKYSDYIEIHDLQGVYCCIKKDKKKLYQKINLSGKPNGFMLSCSYGYYKMTRMFVEYFNVDINITDCLGRDGFFYACKSRNMEVIQYLVNRGANIQLCDKQGMQGIDYIEENHRFQIFDLIHKY